MPTPLATITVAVATLAEHVQALLLRPREVTLKHKAPKSHYVHQLIRDVRKGRRRPVHMWLAISLEDVEDPAVPLDEVLEPYRRAMELLTARRREIETHGVNAPSILPGILRAMDKEAAENKAEARAIANPDDVEALEAVLSTNAAERDAEDRRNADIRERITALRTRQLPRVARLAAVG